MMGRDLLASAKEFLIPLADRSRSAEDIFCFVLGCKREDLYFYPERVITPIQQEKIQNYLQRRLSGEPLAYILGLVSFYDCSLMITPDVLIPRQETELLVDRVARYIEKNKLQHKEVWDIGTGSGCIAIALKKKFPFLQVVASDISEKALAVARKNAKTNQVDITFLHGDLLDPFEGRKCDILISNPPYISQEEFNQLDEEVKTEPHVALLGGTVGSEIYQRFSICAKFYLHTPSALFMEIGYRMGPQIVALFEKEGWGKGNIFLDLEGRDRFFFLEIE
jgi:release factor glutamine methyltransferase